MDETKRAVAESCLDAAESGALSFPQIVGRLMEAGFESYAVDFRRGVAAYCLPDGDVLELPATRIDVAAAFDGARVRAAIGEAQRLDPGYTYDGFRRKVAAAGCAGYMVSFSGRRALYVGRTAETHVELFPD